MTDTLFLAGCRDTQVSRSVAPIVLCTPLQADANQSSDLFHSIVFSLEERGGECKMSSQSGFGFQYSQALQCGSGSFAPTGVSRLPAQDLWNPGIHLQHSIIPVLMFSQTGWLLSSDSQGSNPGMQLPRNLEAMWLLLLGELLPLLGDLETIEKLLS